MIKAMTMEDHALLLGKLLGNFHSLEFTLRIYLANLPGARPLNLSEIDIYKLAVGAELPANDLTSFDPLALLIEKFNKNMRLQGLQEIGPSLIEVRDALAHGRVSVELPQPPLRLIKFDREDKDKGTVRVSFNVIMNEDWFKEQTRSIFEAIKYCTELSPAILKLEP